MKRRKQVNHFLEHEDKKQYNYVAIFYDKIQFYQEITPQNWKDLTTRKIGFDREEWCDVYTNIDFKGNIETGIITYDGEREEDIHDIKISDKQSLYDYLKSKISICTECAKDKLIDQNRNNDVMCIYCGKVFCLPHMIIHLKENHWTDDKLHLKLEVD